MPQPISMFGLSPDDAQQAQQAQDQQNAFNIAQLNRGQLTNYNGALTGAMLGHGIESAFGIQSPMVAKAKKLQEVEQMTEQQAPWQTDPEAHMKLAISNMMKAGLQTEAGNAYQHYLDFQKQQTEGLREKSYAKQVDLAGAKQAKDDAADANLPALIAKFSNPDAQAIPATMPNTAQPSGNFQGDPQAIMDEISRIKDPSERQAATTAFQAQSASQQPTAKPYAPRYPEAMIQALYANGGAKAKELANYYSKVNEQGQKDYNAANVVPAATKFLADNKPNLVLTADADGNPIYTKQKDAVGMTPAAKPTAASGSALSDDAVDLAATRYRIDGTMPSLGMGSASTRAKILNRAAEMAVAEGNTAEASSLRMVANKANAQALGQLTKQEQLVSSFEKTANKNADLALALSDKVDRAGSPVFDRWVQSGRKSIAGDSAVASFHAANETFVNEYAKIISGSMGNTPVSDQARQHAHEILDTAFTKDQYVAVMKVLKQEMGNRMSGFADQKRELMANIQGTTAAPQATTPMQESVSKSGKPIVSKDGGKSWEYK